jgi:hypothetical protein
MLSKDVIGQRHRVSSIQSHTGSDGRCRVATPQSCLDPGQESWVPDSYTHPSLVKSFSRGWEFPETSAYSLDLWAVWLQ